MDNPNSASKDDITPSAERNADERKGQHKSKMSAKRQCRIEVRPTRQDADISSFDGHYGPNDHHRLTVTLFSSGRGHGTLLVNTSLGYLIENVFSLHDEREKKDGPCIVLAECDDGRCDGDVIAVHAVGYDIDGTLTVDEACKRLDALGHEAIIYTSHSHSRTRQGLPFNTYLKWHKKHLGDRPITDETVGAFCAQNKKTKHLTNVRLADGGRVYDKKEWYGKVPTFDIAHDPEPKFRVVLPLARPIPLKDGTVTTSENKELYQNLGRRVFGEGNFSSESSNPARVHYLPSHKSGCEALVFHSPGTLVDLLAEWAPPEKRPKPRPCERARQNSQRTNKAVTGSNDVRELRHVLTSIPPDLPRNEWLKVLGGIHHETVGSETGRALAHEWSGGAGCYSEIETESIWDWFCTSSCSKPSTMGTLIWLAREYDPHFDENPKKEGRIDPRQNHRRNNKKLW